VNDVAIPSAGIEIASLPARGGRTRNDRGNRRAVTDTESSIVPLWQRGIQGVGDTRNILRGG